MAKAVAAPMSWPLQAGRALALLVGLWVFSAWGHPGASTLTAARAPKAPVVDGLLGDEWAFAPAFDAFVQRFPNEGARPSERTRVRVAYDDRFLYVAVECFDSRPQDLARGLGRRDGLPPSDLVRVFVDSGHDHRSAYVFVVNAAGVIEDGLIYEDSEYTKSWDGNWDAAAALFPEGWSAELAIPLGLLRFPAAATQTWGFHVERELHRLNETSESQLIPRSAAGKASRLGHLSGLDGLEPKLGLTVTPYLAARGTAEHQANETTAFPSADLGGDFRASVASNLTLAGTVNPDFGQVEADQILQNLSTFETFFPEKRPFFTEGMDLFTPVGSSDGRSPQMLFYSRRIGLSAPILAAAKLSGAASDDVRVGVLDALVVDAHAPRQEPKDRSVRFHLERPLHLGPNHELPEAPSAPTNFFTGIARANLGPQWTVGGTVATATPLTGPCGTDEATRPPGCSQLGANAAAADFQVRGEEWRALGQVTLAQGVGGPLERTLADGTRVRPGDLGVGTYLALGRVGGEPWRASLELETASPRLDLNPTGYLRTQNLQRARVETKYTRPNSSGPFRSYELRLKLESSTTADGRWLPRGTNASLDAWVFTQGFHYLGAGGGFDDPRFDVRHIYGSGIPIERQRAAYAYAFLETDSRPMLGMSTTLVGGYRVPTGPLGSRVGYTVDVSGRLRPHPATQTELSLSLDYTPFGPRHLDTEADGSLFFGDQHARYLSVLLRQQVLLSPRLSLQAYAQLFTAYHTYERAFRAAPTSLLRIAELQPADDAVPGSRGSTLTLNLVLRWEYRRGSTLFVVYSREQSEAPSALEKTLLPVRLFDGPSTQQLLFKLTYAFDT